MEEVAGKRKIMNVFEYEYEAKDKEGKNKCHNPRKSEDCGTLYSACGI